MKITIKSAFGFSGVHLSTFPVESMTDDCPLSLNLAKNYMIPKANKLVPPSQTFFFSRKRMKTIIKSI